MSTHAMVVHDSLASRGVPLLDFSASIEFRWRPESGDGWNEPRCPAYAEFVSVGQINGPTIPSADLIEWAEAWLEENEHEAAAFVRGEIEEAIWHKAEMAREDAR